MCWNASVSLNTYLFSTFACLFALLNNVITIPQLFFLQSFMLIQLVEYFVWWSPPPSAHVMLSQLALLLILLQPLAGFMCLDEPVRHYALPLSIAYIAFLALIFTAIKPWSHITFKMTPSSNGHLAWHWLEFPPFIIGIWLLFLLSRYILNGAWLMSSIVAILAGITYALFSASKTWGSLWCWIANSISIFLIATVFWGNLCTLPQAKN